MLHDGGYRHGDPCADVDCGVAGRNRDRCGRGSRVCVCSTGIYGKHFTQYTEEACAKEPMLCCSGFLPARSGPARGG